MPNTLYFRLVSSKKPDLPLFIFLPGMDGTGDLLHLQVEGLMGQFDIRCLVIPLDDLNSLQHLAQEIVLMVKDALNDNPARLVYLCGESFGGCLALKVIQQAPTLFSHLILVNPASSFQHSVLAQWGASLAPYLPQAFYRLSCIALMPILAALGRVRERDRQALLTAMQSVSQTSVLWRLSELSKFSLSNTQLRAITQPTLLIASEGDRLLPSLEEALRLERQLPNAVVYRLPYSGHACLLEGDVNLYRIMKGLNFLPSHEPLVSR